MAALCMLSYGTVAHAADPEMTIQAQQTKKITGTVVDATGEPIIGATVMQKGTSNGTVTDINGNFTISVPTGSTLIISSIGFSPKEIAIMGGGTSNYNVTLTEDSKSIDEVVVTALGIKREKKALGYAMTELKGDELNQNLINPVSALQGKVAGVEINQSDGGMFGRNKILIRGASTLNANNQPIYVIDGIIMDNSTHSSSADWDEKSNDYGNELKNLNPADFESVSVLKGAAATALYGSRGLNGAVVITTKSGKGTKGLGINFTQSIGFDILTSTPDLQNEFGDGFLSGYLKGREKGWDNNFDVRQKALDADGNFSIRNTQGYYGWGPAFDGSNAIYYDGTTRAYSPYKNNYRDAFQTGFNTTTNVAITGGNDKTTFYTSLGYKYSESTTENNDFKRFNFLAKASHKISSKVELEASVAFANSTPRNAPANIGIKFVDTTWGRAYDTKTMKHLYKGEHGGLASADYGDKNGFIPGRDVWWSIYENNYYQKETQVRPTIKLSAEILPWLRFIGEANYNYYYTRYEQKNPGSGYANEGGYYSLGNTTKEQTNLNLNLNAQKQFGDFDVHGFIRGEYYNAFSQGVSLSTNGGLVVPNQYFIANSKKTPNYDGKVFGEKRIYSIAAQAGFSWKDQIFMDITGRNDWSSALLYADGHGNYSYFYPSVSGSWLISNTFREQLPEWISFAKIRASWAQVGNDTDPYVLNTAWILTKSKIGNTDVYGAELPNTTYSSNLKPERKNSWEVGLDWRFFNNRVGIDFTYYKENTKDQIMKISVPYESGQTSQYVNAGDIQNQGIELALNTTPFQNKDWTWDLNFTYTRNRSKIVSLHENVADYIALPDGGDVAYGNFRVGAVAKVGGAYGLILSDSGIEVDEVSGMQVLDFHPSQKTSYYARSGKVTEMGDINPKFLGSLNTSLRYKNWRLSISLDARFGGKVASYGSHYGTAYGFTKASLKWRNAAHGGTTFTSRYDGVTYDDGVCPVGIFKTGTVIDQGDGTNYTVGTGQYSSGETFAELLAKGKIEPSHSNAFQYRHSQWINASANRGVVSDEWFVTLNYIALREIALAYTFPQSIASKIGSKNLALSFTAHNLGYLLNSMPNGENPEAVRGTSAAAFRMRNFDGVTSSFMFTLNATF